MPSEPSLFDDEHEPITTATESAPTPSTDDRSRGPNYLFRRAVVIGGIVAVLATASVVIGRMIGSGGGETVSGAAGTDWNRIVLVDGRTGRVIVDADDGEEHARIESGVRSPTVSSVVDTSAVVASNDNLAVINLAGEEVAGYEFGAESVVAPVGSALTMLARQSNNTRALLVHGPTNDVIDTDAYATVVGARYDFLAARSTASGRDVLVTDSGNFQSVLFSFDRDEPSFFAGLALGIDNTVVVTAQNVGNEATVNVFDHDGKPKATGRTPSVRAAMITGTQVILVTVDGQVLSMSTSNGNTTERGTLSIGTVDSGAVVPTHDRLVVSGTTGTAVIDATGDVLDTYDGLHVADTPTALHGSSCVPLQHEDDTASQIVLVDVATGDIVVEGDAPGPLVSDATGCVVATPTEAGFDVLSSDGVERFDNGDVLVALSPDANFVVVERDRRLRLLSLDDSTIEPVDLGPRGRLVHFTES